MFCNFVLIILLVDTLLCVLLHSMLHKHSRKLCHVQVHSSLKIGIRKLNSKMNHLHIFLFLFRNSNRWNNFFSILQEINHLKLHGAAETVWVNKISADDIETYSFIYSIQIRSISLKKFTVCIRHFCFIVFRRESRL